MTFPTPNESDGQKSNVKVPSAMPVGCGNNFMGALRKHQDSTSDDGR
jgi:hypothetical protein